jgi:adenine-specific DNA methylase
MCTEEISNGPASQGNEVMRPIQYMGSKLRSLNEIDRAINSLKKYPKASLDLFSGSSVVSQLLRKKKQIVHSNDALKFSATIANTFIGDKPLHTHPLELLNYFCFENVSNNFFDEFIAIEKKSIQKRKVN